MQKGFALIFILIAAIVLAASAGGIYYFQKQQAIKKINSFDECAKAGYPIMESYSARCATPDGRSFTQELSEEEKRKLIPPIDTTNWRTYTDKENGYLINYPKDWLEANVLEFLDLSDYYPSGWKVFKSPNAQLDKNKKLISGSFFFVQVFDSEMNLEDLEKQIRSAPGFLSSERTRISGMEAVKAIGQSEAKDSKNISITIKISQRKGFLISCNIIPSDTYSFNLCEQILSTLRFLETSTSPTSSSKNQCGDGVCQEVACLAIGCPEPETAQSCPADCK